MKPKMKMKMKIEIRDVATRASSEKDEKSEYECT